MALTVRLPDVLKTEADAYAHRVGISVNALIAVALRDYLDSRSSPAAVPTASAAGLTESARATEKVGRNEPCPCGSGKKYKLCHGRP